MEHFESIAAYKQHQKDLAVTVREEKNRSGYSSKKKQLSYRFRHYHIAYCLLRGKKYEQVELSVRSFLDPQGKVHRNDPDKTFIENILAENEHLKYVPKPKVEQTESTGQDCNHTEAERIQHEQENR